MTELFSIVQPNVRAARRDTRDWSEAVAVLKANPGEFILIAKNEAHRQLASTIKAGKNKAFTAGEFTAVSQKASEGEGFDILASYVGGNEFAAEEEPDESVRAEYTPEEGPAPTEAPLVESAPAADDSDDWS